MDPSAKDSLLRNNAGVFFAHQGRLHEAINEFDAAAALNPDFADAMVNAARAARELGRLADAQKRLESILARWPRHPGGLLEQACVCALKDDLDGEIHFYRAALREKPNDAKVHWNLGLALLRQGSLQEGFAEFEWRFRCPEYAPYAFQAEDIAYWQGQELSNKSILVVCEQGLGDAIQFVRYTNLLTERGAHVVVRCWQSMQQLLSSCPGVSECVSANAEVPRCDYWISMLSLPYRMETEQSSIPAFDSYLSADPILIRGWAERLNSRRGAELRIGLNWKGSSKNPRDVWRSFKLQELESLFEIPNVAWYELQKHAPEDSVSEPSRWPIEALGNDLDNEGHAFWDTAAVMMNLDLVIGCDSAVCHLAGSLGVPCWILLDKRPDWRWQRSGSTTPWYPKTLLFRQGVAGDWSHAVAAVRERLETMAARGV